RRSPQPKTVSDDLLSFPSEERSLVEPKIDAGTDVARQHPKMSAAPPEAITEQTVAPDVTLSTTPVVSVPRVPSPTRDFSSKNRETGSEAFLSGAKGIPTGASPAELSTLS